MEGDLLAEKLSKRIPHKCLLLLAAPQAKHIRVMRLRDASLPSPVAPEHAMEVVERMKTGGFAAVEKDIAAVIAHFRAKNSSRGEPKKKAVAVAIDGAVPTLYQTCINFILKSPLMTAERTGNVFTGISPGVAMDLLSTVFGTLEKLTRTSPEKQQLQKLAELLASVARVRKLSLPGPLLTVALIYQYRSWVFNDLLKCFPDLKELKMRHCMSRLLSTENFDFDCLSCLGTLEVLHLPKAAASINFADLLLCRNLRDLECNFSKNMHNSTKYLETGQVMKLQRLVIHDGPRRLNASKLSQLVALMPELQKLDCRSVLLKCQDYGKGASELVSALDGRELLLEQLELHGRHVPSIGASTLKVELLKVVGPVSEDVLEQLHLMGGVRCLELDSVQPAFVRAITETFGKDGLKELVITAESSFVMRETRRNEGQYDFLENQELELASILAAAPELESFSLEYNARLELSVEIGAQHLKRLKQFYICPEAVAKANPQVLNETLKNILFNAEELQEFDINPELLEVTLERLKSEPEWGLSLKKITFVELTNEKSLLLAFEVGALLVLRQAQIETVDFNALGNYGSVLIGRLRSWKEPHHYWYGWHDYYNNEVFEPTWFWDLLWVVGVSSEVTASRNGVVRSFKVVR